VNLITFIKIAYADGSLNAQLVIIQYSVNNQLPDGFGSQDDTATIEDLIRLSYLSFINESSFTYTITEIRVHQYCTGTAGYTNEMTYLVYKGNESSPYATDLLYNFTISRDGNVYGWFSKSCNIDVPTGEEGVYIGAWMDSVSGVWSIYRDNTVSGAYSAHKTENHPGTIPTQAPDPLTGETQDTSYAVEVTIDYDAHNETSTTHNQYYGTEDDYIARRDLNTTFPSGVSNRIVKITYPTSESLLNITYNNAGEFNTTIPNNELTLGDYNSTHRYVEIDESDISSYGTEFRVFTESYDYQYLFYGPYYENGTAYNTTLENILVTAHSLSGNTEFNASNGYIYASDEKPILFSYSISTILRRLYVYNDTETFYVFYPEDIYANYEFDINDYTGKTAQGESYLESYRSVNGTSRMVERMSIKDVVNNVPLLLVKYQTYNLIIRFSDNSIYTFGIFIAGVDPTPILSITEISFGEQAHTVYQYIVAEASRPNATSLRMIYQDSSPEYNTIRVNFTVEYRNGTQAYNESIAGSQSITFNWYGADNETDYVVELWADHQYHGEIGQKWVLDYSRSFGTFPNLNALGTWPFPSKNIFSLMISLLVAGLFSFGSMTLAPFIFMTFLSAFTYIGLRHSLIHSWL